MIRVPYQTLAFHVKVHKFKFLDFSSKFGVFQFSQLVLIPAAAMELGLALMLRAAWLAGTLPIVLASIPYSRLSFLHKTLLGFSSRGKTREHSSSKYTVPQNFFLHFYMVSALWTTLLLLSTWFYAYRTEGSLVSEAFHYSTVASHLMGGSHVFSIHKSHLAPVERRFLVWRTVLLLLLMDVQVLRRLYETLYVFSYSPSARMHIFGYLTGMFFYIAASVSLCSSCAYEALSYTTQQVALFIVKDRAQKEVIEFDWRGYVNPFLKLHFIQWMGVAIFIWGWIHQYRCHAILGSLREHNDQASEYAIPRGDWFEIVSCPHYLAEIVIYAGLLVASGGSDITVWFLLVFVVSNLVFAAAETQRWYLRKFDNYPRSRRAILPFVY